MSEVKVYGIQRSGNNWLMCLLASNFKVNILGNKKGGWTHGPMEVVKKWGKEPDVVLLIVKHPLCWLPSIWRYRGRGRGAFDVYALRSKEVEIWNRKYRDWLAAARKLANAHFEIVRYEEWLADPVGHLSALHTAAGLEKKPGPWRLPQNKMNKHMGETGQPFDPAYYLQRKFMNTYPRRVIRLIMKRIDGKVLEELGYGRTK